MPPDHGTSLQTSPTLLERLRTGDDAQSWQEFYRTYGGLIRSFAEKSGLTVDEAEEVVQETAIGVARGLPEFVYDPQVCRFKTWLLNLTRWRIQNQLRKRPRIGGTPAAAGAAHAQPSDDTSGTGTVERLPDPAVPEFGAEWDSAWEKNLLAQALQQLRPRLNDRQFQAFDLYVSKGWPPADVARTVGMSVARVYLAKHRVSALLKKEVQRLERAAEQAVRERG